MSGAAAPKPDPAGLPPEMRRMEAQAAFQRRAWAWERVSWAALALIVAAGLLGLLGRQGWLSDAAAETADGVLRIRYQRMQRLLAPTDLEVEVLETRPDGFVDLRLGRDLLEDWQVQSITPSPAASRGESGTLVLRFPVAAGPAPVARLRLEPTRIGPREATVGAGGAPARLRVLVWP
jgi:hypothetical protein